jgi:transcriptional regulator with XRE-family HTH domain
MGEQKRFGLRVRELRKKAGLTQEALGERAGVNYKFVGGIERGEENPSLAVLRGLARGLNVDLADFFEVEHVGADKELRATAKRLIDEAPPDDLRRFLRVLKALVR